MEIAKKYHKKEDLEFELLEDVNIEDLDVNENLVDKFDNLLEYTNRKMAIIVKELDDKLIARNGGTFYLIFKKNYEVGEMVCFSNNHIFKIEKEIFDNDFLESLREKTQEGNRVDLDDFEDEEILTKDRLEKHILDDCEKCKREQELDDKRIKDRRQEKEDENQKNRKSYEEESIGNFPQLEVDKKTISRNGELYTLKKNVNKIFDYESLDRNLYNVNIPNLEAVEDMIISRKLDYTKEKVGEDGSENTKLYKLEFERDTKKEIISNLSDKEFVRYPKIKGIRIPQNKLGFILSKIHKEQTEEQIKLLKKLTGMKMDLLDIKQVYCSPYEVDIEISLCDENNFEIEFMNKKKRFDWVTLKDIFFYGRSPKKNLNKQDFFGFCGKFGLKKEDIFTYLKKIKMMNELKE